MGPSPGVEVTTASSSSSRDEGTRVVAVPRVQEEPSARQQQRDGGGARQQQQQQQPEARAEARLFRSLLSENDRLIFAAADQSLQLLYASTTSSRSLQEKSWNVLSSLNSRSLFELVSPSSRGLVSRRIVAISRSDRGGSARQSVHAYDGRPAELVVVAERHEGAFRYAAALFFAESNHAGTSPSSSERQQQPCSASWSEASLDWVDWIGNSILARSEAAAVLEFDANGKVTFASSASALTSVIGLEFLDMVHPDDATRVIDSCKYAFEHGLMAHATYRLAARFNQGESLTVRSTCAFGDTSVLLMWGLDSSSSDDAEKQEEIAAETTVATTTATTRRASSISQSALDDPAADPASPASSPRKKKSRQFLDEFESNTTMAASSPAAAAATKAREVFVATNNKKVVHGSPAPTSQQQHRQAAAAYPAVCAAAAVVTGASAAAVAPGLAHRKSQLAYVVGTTSSGQDSDDNGSGPEGVCCHRLSRSPSPELEPEAEDEWGHFITLDANVAGICGMVLGASSSSSRNAQPVHVVNALPTPSPPAADNNRATRRGPPLSPMSATNHRTCRRQQQSDDHDKNLVTTPSITALAADDDMLLSVLPREESIASFYTVIPAIPASSPRNNPLLPPHLQRDCNSSSTTSLATASLFGGRSGSQLGDTPMNMSRKSMGFEMDEFLSAVLPRDESLLCCGADPPPPPPPLSSPSPSPPPSHHHQQQYHHGAEKAADYH